MHQGYRECDCNCNRVHSFFIANHSFDDSYFGKQGESEKEKCTEVVKEFLLEKHQKVPLMQQCNKNVENGVKNIHSVNQSLVLLMPRPSAPSTL